MKDKILSLTVSSADDLEKQLNRIRSNERQKYEYLVLSLGGKEMIVQPFSFHNLPIRKLKDQLQMEAIDLLNLPANQIVYDFQIFQASKEEISGVFVCIPKEYLMQLSTIVQKYKMSLVLVTPYLLSSLNSFMVKLKMPQGRFCLLDFSDDRNVNLSVIRNRQFELLRRVPYDSLEEAKNEIIRSLRSANAKSPNKDFDGIHLRGQIPDKELFVAELASFFNIQMHTDETGDVEEVLLSDDSMFSINLMRNYCMSLEERKKALLATHVFLGLCLLGNAYLGFKINNQSRIIQTLKNVSEDETYEIAKVERPKKLVKL